MSRIGNKGFTLLEVVITTAVLSLGAALIYQTFFVTLDTYNYSSNLLNTIPWMDNKVWQAQDAIARSGDKANLDTAGELDSAGKKIIWNLSVNSIGDGGSLYKVNLQVYWRQGQRNIQLSRSAYAIYTQE